MQNRDRMVGGGGEFFQKELGKTLKREFPKNKKVRNKRTRFGLFVEQFD